MQGQKTDGLNQEQVLQRDGDNGNKKGKDENRDVVHVSVGDGQACLHVNYSAGSFGVSSSRRL